MSQVQNLLILKVATVQLCRFSVILGTFWSKTLDSVTMATEVQIKELSMHDLALGENKQEQKVLLKSETMREKLCSIFTENRS